MSGLWVHRELLHWRAMKTGPKPKPLAERFWPKVRIAGQNECWEWLASRNWKGYGRIGYRALACGYTAAHRAAWELTRGPIPEGAWVLHRCDNPPCCNPAHLFLGTGKDNSDDMFRKGRGRPGRTGGAIKLSLDDVATIKAKTVGLSRTQRYGLIGALAREYRVSRHTVGAIASGRYSRKMEKRDISPKLTTSN